MRRLAPLASLASLASLAPLATLWVVASAALVGCGDGGGDDGPTAAARRACVDETNRYRAMAGKPPLVASPALEAYADEGAAIDFASAPHHHFSSTSGGGLAFAENECPAQGNWTLAPGGALAEVVASCVGAFHAEGPGTDYATHGHYINMMGDYGTLGCGFYQEGDALTIVQDFGR